MFMHSNLCSFLDTLDYTVLYSTDEVISAQEKVELVNRRRKVYNIKW